MFSKRLTDEEVYIDEYLKHYRKQVTIHGELDGTPEVGLVEGELPDFGPTTLHIGHHLNLPSHYSSALRDVAGMSLGSTVILTDKQHYENTKILKSISLVQAGPRKTRITLTLDNPQKLFSKARNIRDENISASASNSLTPTLRSKKSKKVDKEVEQQAERKVSAWLEGLEL